MVLRETVGFVFPSLSPDVYPYIKCFVIYLDFP